jgi:hypothetical protein
MGRGSEGGIITNINFDCPSDELRLELPFQVVCALMSQIRNSFDSEVEGWIQDPSWITGPDVPLKLAVFARQQNRKIAKIAEIYVSDTVYWSASKYFVFPFSQAKCTQIFEAHELREAYKVLGRQRLAQANLGCLSQVVYMIKVKLGMF